MTKTQLIINLNEPAWKNSLPSLEDIANAVVVNSISFVQQNEKDIEFLNFNKPVIINLCLSNDREIQALNRQFRNLDKPTNVLSFANIDDPEFEKNLTSCDEVELGDIIIALETMQRESTEKSISLNDHFCHLLTHGILHLLGFDHVDDDEAEYMEDFEINILQQLNINNPYQE